MISAAPIGHKLLVSQTMTPPPRPASPHLPRLVLVALTLAPAAARAGAQIEADPAPDAQPILGGDVVGPCGWPNVVSIGGFCSGTLIHPQVVLYAAHCGDEVPWIRFTDAIDNEQRREVVPEACATHPVGEFGFGTDFAFCRLAEPVTDVPITPPLVGCDADAMLKVGQTATVVGFGESDNPDNPYGIKRSVNTTIEDFSWDEVFVGNAEEGACYGDSGGPALVQLADGTWRVFGVTSWGKPGCGAGNYFSLVHNGVDWIETASGIDVTPCTDALGAWDPSPACGAFASQDPGLASGAWDTCTFAPVSGPSTTCGSAFDDAPDTTAPVVTIVEPADGSEVPGEMGAPVELVITVEASDVGWGTEAVALRILDGAGEKELYATVDAGAPFVFPPLAFNTGLWTLEATGVDRAGNQSEPDRVVFGVNVAPAIDTGDTDTTGETGGTTTSDATTSEATTSDATTSSDGATTGASSDDEGCGCTTTGPGPAGWMLGVLGLAHRRRRRALLAGALTLGGCAGDDTASTGTGSTIGDATSTSTTTATDEPTSTSSAETGTSTTAAAPACGDGQLDVGETCDDGNLVDGDGCNADCIPSGAVGGIIPLDGVDAINDLALDPAGNIIAVGYAAGAGLDAWIGAFDPSGVALWSASLAGDGGLDDFFRAVTIGDDGEIIAVGATGVDKDTSDLLVARYDGAGEEIAIHVVQDDPSVELVAVDVAAGDAGVAVVVQIDGTHDGASSLRAIDPDGATVWTRSLAATARGGAIARVQGGPLIAGAREILDNTRSDARIAAVDAGGAILWTKAYGEPLTDYYVNALTVDEAGAIAIGGTIVRASAVDSLAIALGPKGDLTWIARPAMAGPGLDEIYDVTFADAGDLIFAGSGFGKEGYDMWYGRLDGAGDPRWTCVYTDDGPYSDSAAAIERLGSGDLVLGGRVTIDGIKGAALVWASP